MRSYRQQIIFQQLHNNPFDARFLPQIWNPLSSDGKKFTLHCEKLSPPVTTNPCNSLYFRMSAKTLLSMMEFCKEVLTKVSFDRLLFRKELQKAIRWLKRDELSQFKQWCLEQFGGRYREIILSSFRPVIL